MPPSFVALAFQKGLKDRKSNLKILNGNDVNILCTKLVTFGPVTQELRGENCNFQDNRQKFDFLIKCWTDLDQIFRFGRHMGGDD